MAVPLSLHLVYGRAALKKVRREQTEVFFVVEPAFALIDTRTSKVTNTCIREESRVIATQSRIAQDYDMLTSKYCLKLLRVPHIETATSSPPMICIITSALCQQTLRIALQSSSIRLAVFNSNLLIVPVVPGIVVSDQIVSELVTVCEEPAV